MKNSSKFYICDGKFYIRIDRSSRITLVKERKRAKLFRSMTHAKRFIDSAEFQEEKIKNMLQNAKPIPKEKAKDIIQDTSDKSIIQQKRISFSKTDRNKIFCKTSGRCYICGQMTDMDTFTIDHIVPLSRGGTNEFSNLACAHQLCNSLKSDMLMSEFLEKINLIASYQKK